MDENFVPVPNEVLRDRPTAAFFCFTSVALLFYFCFTSVALLLLFCCTSAATSASPLLRIVVVCRARPLACTLLIRFIFSKSARRNWIYSRFVSRRCPWRSSLLGSRLCKSACVLLFLVLMVAFAFRRRRLLLLLLLRCCFCSRTAEVHAGFVSRAAHIIQ